MKPFEYVKPNTLAEAISALDAGGEDARALSGGTDLIVQMRAGRNVVGNVIVDSVFELSMKFYLKYKLKRSIIEFLIIINIKNIRNLWRKVLSQRC